MKSTTQTLNKLPEKINEGAEDVWSTVSESFTWCAESVRLRKDASLRFFAEQELQFKYRSECMCLHNIHSTSTWVGQKCVSLQVKDTGRCWAEWSCSFRLVSGGQGTPLYSSLSACAPLCVAAAGHCSRSEWTKEKGELYFVELVVRGGERRSVMKRRWQQRDTERKRKC